MDNPALAKDLRQEYDALSDRRSFGLNFERHVPEAVELPGRTVRKSDKVRILPPRGEKRPAKDERLWQVIGFTNTDRRQATLLSLDREEETTSFVDDLVVVAEFRDPIYPGLISTGKIERGGNKPFHSVVNAENFHALQTLLFTHRGKIDCIYIDPPYNTEATDWKYNNKIVQKDDLYRHSKWLAFMERRLLIAKDLLNHERSALIVAIDANEVHRLGLLLEQLFPEAKSHMISTITTAKGKTEGFKRIDEYLFVLLFGEQAVFSRPDIMLGSKPADEREPSKKEKAKAEDEDEADVPIRRGIDWQTFRRRDMASRRGTKKGGPRQFYPIYVNTDTGRIEGYGDPLPHHMDRSEAPSREGCQSVFPIRKDGTEMNWSLVGPSFEERWKLGYCRAGSHTPDQPQQYIIQYLKSGSIKDIDSGRAISEGKHSDGSIIAYYEEADAKAPRTQWHLRSHNNEFHGTKILKKLVPGRTFPFPKSLYGVEDVIRLVTADNPDAVILDFFAGSGTTAHAVMRLNQEDGSSRQSISITNNEVSASERDALTRLGLRPGDADWERLGICDYITKPRILAAVTGITSSNVPIPGSYEFGHSAAYADGLAENVEFLTVTYETPLRVASHREFVKIAPMLWMRAGSVGRRIEDISAGWDVAQAYGVIADLDQTEVFLEAISESETVRTAFIVTDEDRLFESLVAALPTHVEPVRLYEAYLRNFEIEAGRSTR